MSKIRTEISIESNESFVVRRKRYSVRSWCDDCERVAIFVRPTEAAFLAGIDLDIIVSLICSRDLHTFDTGRFGTYVCLMSLCLLNQKEDVDLSEYEVISRLPDVKDRELLFLDKKPS